MIVACTCRLDEINSKAYWYWNQTYHEYFKRNNINYILISDYRNVDWIVEICDMLILVGGYDIHPSFYHKEIDPNYNHYHIESDLLDIILLKAFHDAKKPALGICRGMQLINVYFNGTLFMDIKNHMNTKHKINIQKNHLLKKLYGSTLEVNSYHHQAIDILGKGLTIEAISNDGIIEPISYDNYIIGIQWHPELMDKDIILSYF